MNEANDKPSHQRGKDQDTDVQLNDRTADYANQSVSDDSPISSPQKLEADQRDNEHDADFDWNQEDEAEDHIYTSQRGPKEQSLMLLIHKTWFQRLMVAMFAIVLAAISVVIHVQYEGRPSDVSTNLELWFTFITFIYVMAIAMHYVVEIIPGLIKCFASKMTPTNLEILKMRLAYYHALKRYLKVLFVLAWAWGAWSFLIVLPHDERNFGYTWVVKSFLEALFFASAFLFVEKFLLQLIVTSFHRKAYSERIEKNDHALKVLDKLKKSIRKRPPFDLRAHDEKHQTNERNCKETREDSNEQGKRHTWSSGNSTSNGKEVQHNESVENENNRENGNTPKESPGPVRFAAEDNIHINIPAENKERSQSLPTKLSQKVKDLKNRRPVLSSRSSAFDAKSFLDFGTTNLKAVFNNKAKSMTSILPGTQNSRQEAKWLARQLFNNMVTSNRDHLEKSDFAEYFASTAEAERAFDIFDRDKKGDITKRELRNGTLQIFGERKHLAASLRDLSQASGKLDNILMTAFAVVWVIIVCAAFGVDVGSQLLPLWTMFVAISFIFGNSAKDMFESIIFVFVTHPYDVGDRVFVGTENWTIVEIDLLTTTFKKWDGTLGYARNSVIAPQYILNLRRSGPMAEVLEFNIHFSTPADKIYRLRERMLEWYNEKPRSYTHNTMCMNIMSMENMNKITCIFYIEHCASWQDMGFRWGNRNAFLMQMKATLEDLKIGYSLPTQPICNAGGLPDELNNFGKYVNYGAKGHVDSPLPVQQEYD